MGHIRDLPSKAAEIPDNLKKQPWARLGVDVDHDFEPLYIVPANKKAQVTKLKAHGNEEVAFRVAVKDGKVAFTAKGLKSDK